MIKIKNYEIGIGKPLICVPVIEEQEEKIIEQIKKLVQMKIPSIEWRMDYYEQAGNIQAVCALAEKVSALMSDTILLATYRSQSEGGEGSFGVEEYCTLLQALADTKAVDLLDVEIFQVDKQRELLDQLHKAGAVVLASHHNFDKTPSVDEMTQYLLRMNELECELCKLAVMPHSKVDTVKLLEATTIVKERFPQQPLITIAMGRDGIASRMTGELFGSCLTFATVGKESAPGQISYQQMEQLLEDIHRCRVE